jgi:undecaprenyl diphosphate synthase
VASNEVSRGAAALEWAATTVGDAAAAAAAPVDTWRHRQHLPRNSKGWLFTRGTATDQSDVGMGIGDWMANGGSEDEGWSGAVPPMGSGGSVDDHWGGDVVLGAGLEVEGEHGLPAAGQATRARGGRSKWDTNPAPLGLDRALIPNHIALIMDGNARWAHQRRLPVSMGHERGVDTLRMIVRCCGAWGVPAVTVYAFSQENWNRDRAEIESLMALLERTLREELPVLVEEGVRVSVMGDMGRVNPDLRRTIEQAVEATAKNDKLRLSVALSYGARQDIVEAARLLAHEAAAGLLDPADISEELVAGAYTRPLSSST